MPAFSTTVGTKPTSPFQSGVSPPGSTQRTTRTLSILGPAVQLVAKNQVADGPGAVDDRDLRRTCSRFSRAYQMAQRIGGMAIPPPMKIRFLPFHFSIGIAVAVGAAEADRVAFLDVPQGLGHAAGAAEAELDEVLPVRNWSRC